MPQLAQPLKECGLIEWLGRRECNFTRRGDIGLDAVSGTQAGGSNAFGRQPNGQAVAPFSELKSHGFLDVDTWIYISLTGYQDLANGRVLLGRGQISSVSNYGEGISA